MDRSARATYSRTTRHKLTGSRAKLDGVRASVNQAIKTGRLRTSPQLDRVINAMEVSFEDAESQLRALQKSGDHEWESQRDAMENAWENLAHSIANLVAHFADGTTK